MFIPIVTQRNDTSFETTERDSFIPRMFGKHRQMRPLFQHRQWSHFDDPWWDYPMVPNPRMSMYEHPFSPSVETTVMPYDSPSITGGGLTEVINNENEFKVRLDVSHFKVEELTVKTVNDRLKIHAKHEERPDDHGSIQREFTRQYILPKDINIDTVTSSLSPEGILTIRAVKKVLGDSNERVIPIIKGDPSEL